MEKRNKEQVNAEKGKILFEALQSGLSFTAAVIRTNVFDLVSARDSADALRTTLQLLENAEAFETIEKAKDEVRKAIGRMRFLASPKRAKQLDEIVDRAVQKQESDSTAENAFARHSDTQCYAPVDNTAGRVARMQKRKKGGS